MPVVKRVFGFDKKKSTHQHFAVLSFCEGVTCESVVVIRMHTTLHQHDFHASYLTRSLVEAPFDCLATCNPCAQRFHDCKHDVCHRKGENPGRVMLVC